MSEKYDPLCRRAGGLLHGGDYNPEQWLDRPDILEQDIRMMREAHVNTATLGVFSWSAYEPSEGEYHFEWLEKVMNTLYAAGIYTILATPSGARPVWLDEKYPEAMRVGRDGVRNLHGVRHNHCPSSPAYREKVRLIDTALARHVGAHPGLLLWHISNELGGECCCPLCRARFQAYLRAKFHGDIDALNRAWWTSFWSHRFQDFSQIDPPMQHGEGSINGLLLEWRRFTSQNTADFLQFEIDTVKAVTPGIPVTTNFMKLYQGLDYRVLAPRLDVVSWDSYPRFGNDSEPLSDTFSENAFDHAVMRSLRRGRPFLLMESAPGLVNWHAFNKLRRPGVRSMEGLQAIACGADSVLYFQWRKGRGSYEQYHGAVVDHLGTDDTRVFREEAALGTLLEKLAPAAGTLAENKAALLFDWPNRWAVADMAGLAAEKKQYEQTCLAHYRAFARLGLDADIVSMTDDLARYKVVAAPMLYLLQNGAAENLRRYVQGGGVLIGTYLTGYVDENTCCWLGGFPGGGLAEVFGLVSEEIDTLYPKDGNTAVFTDGAQSAVRDFAEVLRLQGAVPLAAYGSDYYAGTPAVTEHGFGRGCAYYAAARLDAAGLEKLLRTALRRAGLAPCPPPAGVEVHTRCGAGADYTFYLNTGTGEAVIPAARGRELLSGRDIDGALRLAPLQGAVLEQKK